ncbi:hypothetical protein [Cohnella cholangitidis]|uniref:Uncharacterized protein n=1 Tax=Cohnella cholangitidis TaxID=2598458 RepID=A0A7G5C3E4_9BACL|nr:hypothetical protein [Cohnella cholangitidis]QMV43728.1 hypothetical protein FPL14_23060 [Cohnella cholangitidis]
MSREVKTKLTNAEIKALVVACRELNDKMGFVIKEYYEDFDDLGFKSNNDLHDGLMSATEKLESLLGEKGEGK